MKTILLLILLCFAGASILGTAYLLGQENQITASDRTFDTSIRPFFEKNCFACHSGKAPIADLHLDSFSSAASMRQQPAVLARILDKLQGGSMPPSGMPQPTAAEVKQVTAWIAAVSGAPTVAKTAPLVPAGDPGRVTMRRLNRVEYNNTIRDLLGVNAKPADEFPLDDSGYGFDNNGDVLSLSPLLMEKYMSAAKKMSQLAVYGPTLPKDPGLLVQILGSTGPGQGASVGASIIVLPYSIRGGIDATYVFPKNGEYEFHLEPTDYRGLQQGAPLKPGALVSKAVPTPAGGGRGAAGGGRQGAAGAQQAGGGRQAAAPGPRAAPDPAQIEARNEQLKKDYPLAHWQLLIDGKVIREGAHAGGYNIDQAALPEVVVRIPLTAGEHRIRASFPGLADVDDPLDNILNNQMRSLSVKSIDILGPYNAGSEPPASYRKIFICATRDTVCAQKIVTVLAGRAYRRPATQPEVAQLMGLVSLAKRQNKPFEEGIRMVVEAVLLSPNFLFRVESDAKLGASVTGRPASLAAKPETPGKGGAGYAASQPHFVSDYELASRLSYFLWSSMPDDELLASAASGKLRQRAVLDAQVKRMLADPKVGALVENFGGQWLGLRELTRKVPDPDRFPRVDGDLLRDMQQETLMFISAILKEDRSILDFIDAPFTFLNGPLATHYGIPGVTGEEFRRVELTGGQRSGIVTQAAVLVVSSFPTRTSVVTRGKWVLENVLGTPPPPPPPDVPSLKDSDIGTAVTLRERMEQHRADPACAACHARMDPIGFSLENYDASGAWRTMDGKFPVDVSGTLPDGRKFEGAEELKQILRGQSDLFARNMAEKMLTYALGRGLEPFDKPTAEEITATLKAHNYRMTALISAVVHSKPFQMRSGEPK